MTLSYFAMMFAREVHKDQRRKYTNDPYVIHLAEVAGIAMSVGWRAPEIHPDKFMAVCWLHDCVEDQAVDHLEIQRQFGEEVRWGVMCLSDTETGNRKARKQAARERLKTSPPWVQTIKCADLISNTGSIIQHDPKFAVTYIEEARLLLEVLTKADPKLRSLALAGLASPGPIAGPSTKSDAK